MVKAAENPDVEKGELSDFGPWLKSASILVVDDEPGIRNFLSRTLEPRCKCVKTAADTAEASSILDSMHFDIIILDNIMAGKHGVEWLAEQRSVGFFADTILITAFADLETAIKALRAGAADFVLKPFRSNQILNAIARCLDRLRLQRENYILRYQLQSSSYQRINDQLLGESNAISEVRDSIKRVAPLPTTVLFTGDSGTGKEVAARSVHSLSDRHDKPFVPINCAAIPAEMIESELFGHVRGAFTGAHAGRDGLFLHASGGTLFLDEIGELPMPMQSKLLRVLEERRVRPVGSEREIPVDIRFVFATNALLQEQVEKGLFRADLYFRINVMQIHLPPIKDRANDVQELADLFMRQLSRELGMPPIVFTQKDRDTLANYDWPGNVRELRNFIERALILGRLPDDLQHERIANDTPASSLAEVERRHIMAVLEEVKGNREEAARRLGISRKTIDRKCVTWNA
ncbi:MAG: sigma-54 dependent transcriptional regulator [Pseudomonadota bacterium]